MKLYHQLVKLAKEINNPCVTISLNTHRTLPDREKDKIVLKKLITEAEKRMIHEFGKRSIAKLLDKMSKIEELIDTNYNLDSLHIFISNTTLEMIRLTGPTAKDRVYIANVFDVRAVIKAVSRTEDYLIMLLSRGGVNLYHAMNDNIVKEINKQGFPFPANPHYTTDPEKQSDAKKMDDWVRDYFNQVDKALVNIFHETNMHCIVISAEENYALLHEVADNPDVYIGHAPLDYNHTKEHQIVKQAWEIIQQLQYQKRIKAISEMKEAAGEGKVITDLKEIYAAATEGKGELLIVRDDYTQPVYIDSHNQLELIDTPENAYIEDITSNIAWEVISKNGNVFFTSQDDLKDWGNIVLKTRY